MTITKVTADHYRIPLDGPMTDASHGVHTEFEVVVVRLSTDREACGLGYTYTVGRGGAAVKTLLDVELAPLLLGWDPAGIEAIWQQMWRHLHYIGRGGLVAFAMSAVDIALWDLKGHVTGRPLWQLLGGDDPRVSVYPGGIDLQLEADELAAQSVEHVAAGFGALKVKIGRSVLEEDVLRVRAVRDAVGPETRVMVDANKSYSIDQAIRAARALADLDLYWFEEPIDPDDLAGLARVAREGGIPIAVGENLHTVAEFGAAIDSNAVSFVEPDVTNCGGITAFMEVARRAEAANLPVTSHGVHELHVPLLAALPNASYAEVHGFRLDRFQIDAPLADKGVITASDLPGHGVRFDWEALSSHRVAADTWAPEPSRSH